MKKISVYGSLLSGLGNHRVIAGSKLLNTEVVSVNFRMINFNRAFPGLVESDDAHDVEIETYEVDDDTYRRVEMLEGYPSFYDKRVIETSVGTSEIYFLNGSDATNFIPKTNGVYNWKAFLNNDK